MAGAALSAGPRQIPLPDYRAWLLLPGALLVAVRPKLLAAFVLVDLCFAALFDGAHSFINEFCF